MHRSKRIYCCRVFGLIGRLRWCESVRFWFVMKVVLYNTYVWLKVLFGRRGNGSVQMWVEVELKSRFLTDLEIFKWKINAWKVPTEALFHYVKSVKSPLLHATLIFLHRNAFTLLHTFEFLQKSWFIFYVDFWSGEKKMYCFILGIRFGRSIPFEWSYFYGKFIKNWKILFKIKRFFYSINQSIET